MPADGAKSGGPELFPILLPVVNNKQPSQEILEKIASAQDLCTIMSISSLLMDPSKGAWLLGAIARDCLF